MPKITPLDPKVCLDGYKQLLRNLRELNSEENSTCTSPEPSASTSTPLYEPDLSETDEDSKMSAITLSSVCSSEENIKKKPIVTRSNVLQPISSGKNPRKSPRQHASTLAILSSLLHQRRRRSKNRTLEDSSSTLPPIPEELSQPSTPIAEQEREEQTVYPTIEQPPIRPKIKPKLPQKYHWRFKPKLNYRVLAQNIEDELDSVVDDFDIYNLELEDDCLDFHNSRTNTTEILKMFEETKAKETDKSCRRFFNGTPGRKPGRKRKKNLTGWPNKNKKIPKREHSKDKDEVLDKHSTADSASLHGDDSDADDEPKQTESKKNGSDSKRSSSDVECCDNDRVNVNAKSFRKQIKTEILQPYVYVQKLDNKILGKQICSSARTVKKRMPGSPRSPRTLRKPRGRWYKER